MYKVLLSLVCAGCGPRSTAAYEQVQSPSRGDYEHRQKSFAVLLLAFNLDPRSQHPRHSAIVSRRQRRVNTQLRQCAPSWPLPTSPSIVAEHAKLRWTPEILQKAPTMKKKYEMLESQSFEAAVLQLSELALPLTRVTKYLNASEQERLSMAIEVAFLAHHGQTRRSGEPFLIHPIAVAQDLATRHLDLDSVIAGLLHDTAEDTELTFDEIQAMFGQTVRAIVYGETKVSKLPKMIRTAVNLTDQPLMNSGGEDAQAENLRSMFIAMADDYRIVQVKLADRMHNMKTLEHMPRKKQLIISRETLQIFVPLAHRLGMWDYREGLADLSFKYMYPQEYEKTKSYIELLDKQCKLEIKCAKLVLQHTLRQGPISLHSEITYRRKSVYSTWKKMQKRKLRIEQVKDIMALRVVLNSTDPSDCYEALSKVHSRYLPLPETFKDYIAKPKTNGYKSLHTIVLMDNRLALEIQIRTSEMHEVAEKGAAAHWNKDNQHNKSLPWLKVQAEHQHVDAAEFVQLVKQELQSTLVYVFTRDGQVLCLKSGATVADAANQLNMSKDWMYEHTCKVNDVAVWNWVLLTSGDIISFERSTNQDFNHLMKREEPSLPEATPKRERCPQCMPLQGENLVIARPHVGVDVLHRADYNCRLLQRQLAVQGYKLLSKLSATHTINDQLEHAVHAQLEAQRALIQLQDKKHGLDCTIIVFCRDRRGILLEITNIVMEHVNDISGVYSESRPGGEQAALQYTIRVHNATQLNTLIRTMEAHAEVQRVLRDNIQGLMGDAPKDFWRYGETTMDESTSD